MACSPNLNPIHHSPHFETLVVVELAKAEASVLGKNSEVNRGRVALKEEVRVGEYPGKGRQNFEKWEVRARGAEKAKKAKKAVVEPFPATPFADTDADNLGGVQLNVFLHLHAKFSKVQES